MSKRTNKRRKAVKKKQVKSQKKSQGANAAKKQQAVKAQEKQQERRQEKESISMFNIGKAGGMDFVARIYAEDGMVCAQRHDGVIRRFTVLQAAQRAGQLNEMVKNPALTLHMSEDTVKDTFKFIESIINTCREAQSMIEDPKDNRTELLHNVLNGKDAQGNPIVLEEMPKDFFIEGFMTEFHTLDQREVEVIMNADNNWPTIDKKRTAMRTIHVKRMQEMAGEPV
jgi:hypothetical protein